MTRYDVGGGWVMGLCKKPAWGRQFPPLAPPGSGYCSCTNEFKNTSIIIIDNIEFENSVHRLA